MRVLVVKTSSLGDVIHTLPALSDAAQHCPDIKFDWLVEEAFAEIPAMHSRVSRVIPIALRRWRRQPLRSVFSKDFWQCFKALRAEKYDMIIDAQGLGKSALWAFLARGPRYGLDKKSVREKFACLFYQQTFTVPRQQHAMMRNRELFAKALGYTVPSSFPDHQLRLDPTAQSEKPYIMLLHGTTWATKHWPQGHWSALIQQILNSGMAVKCHWHNDEQKARVQSLQQQHPALDVLPPQSLTQLAQVLAKASGVVSVDTGPGHLATALNKPLVAVFGPTDVHLTGMSGALQRSLSAGLSCSPCLSKTCRIADMRGPNDPPCLAQVSAQQVWEKLQQLMQLVDVKQNTAKQNVIV